MRPAEVFHISWMDLKNGAVDLCDIALMNDYLAMKGDNQARIARWREQHG
ncbi:lytic transglycosylase [Jejubacter sp. L23]